MALHVYRCVDKYPAGADVGVRWWVHVRDDGHDGIRVGLHGSDTHSVSRVDSLGSILPHYLIFKDW